MATALKLYTADGNLNAITKTISNVNPEASNYTLKDFSVKLMNLSDNSLRKVERVDTKDITSATNSGGNITGAIFKSSSPFFSDDSDTFTAAVNELTDTNSKVTFQVNTAMSSENGGITEISDWKKIDGLTNLVNLINYKVIATAPTYIKKATFQKVTNGIWGYNTVGYTNHRMKITGSGTSGIAIVNSLYENKIEVEGFTVNYTEDTANNKVNIIVTKA